MRTRTSLNPGMAEGLGSFTVTVRFAGRMKRWRRYASRVGLSKAVFGVSAPDNRRPASKEADKARNTLRMLHIIVIDRHTCRGRISEDGPESMICLGAVRGR